MLDNDHAPLDMPFEAMGPYERLGVAIRDLGTALKSAAHESAILGGLLQKLLSLYPELDEGEDEGEDTES